MSGSDIDVDECFRPGVLTAICPELFQAKPIRQMGTGARHSRSSLKEGEASGSCRLPCGNHVDDLHRHVFSSGQCQATWFHILLQRSLSSRDDHRRGSKRGCGRKKGLKLHFTMIARLTREIRAGTPHQGRCSVPNEQIMQRAPSIPMARKFWSRTRRRVADCFCGSITLDPITEPARLMFLPRGGGTTRVHLRGCHHA